VDRTSDFLKRARGQFAASATPPKDRLSAGDSFSGQPPCAQPWGRRLHSLGLRLLLRALGAAGESALAAATPVIMTSPMDQCGRGSGLVPLSREQSRRLPRARPVRLRVRQISFLGCAVRRSEFPATLAMKIAEAKWATKGNQRQRNNSSSSEKLQGPSRSLVANR
jgi:hypothetical protein